MEIMCANPNLDQLSEGRLSEIVESSHSDIIVFPEYLLELVNIPEVITDKMIIWGSKKDEGQNRIFIQQDNQIRSRAKICLTPWEKDLKAGDELEVFTFNGLKIAIAICFDIEFPALSVKLKKEKIDVLIVPSATETILGYERISRCASARAVELGCAVITCHLIGQTQNELIDVNVGNHNLYLPSQSAFLDFRRFSDLAIELSGEVIHTYNIPVEKIRAQRNLRDETNPCLEEI